MDATQTALERAKARGMTIDLSAGPSWPAAVPSITPDSDAAIKELAYGRQAFTGATFSGPVPQPVVAPASAATQKQLLYVQAAKVTTAGNPPTTAYTLDRTTLQNLTPDARRQRHLHARPTAATGSSIAYWQRGSGQKPEGSGHTTPDSFVIDHFSQTGTSAITDFWDQHLLTPAIRCAAQGRGRRVLRGLARARDRPRRCGRRASPRPSSSRWATACSRTCRWPSSSTRRPSSTTTPTRHGRVRRDINLVLTNLYNENHLKPLKAWANALGLKLRVQPYGLQTDAMQASALLDIPEGESLGFKNLDDYRRQAGARDLAGNTILSNEAGATAGGAYSTTWETELRKLAPMFAAGVNQNVFHGFSYATTPSARWPGFAAFSPVSNGARATASRGARASRPGSTRRTSRGYFARNQDVMQTGRNIVDAAVLAQTGYVAAGYGAPFFTPDTREAAQVLKDGGTQIGWTNEGISESILDLPNAVVRNGRLAPDGPNFKALVVEGDVAFSRAHLPADRDGAEAARLGQGRPADRDRRQLERADRRRPGQAGRERRS